MVNRVLARVVIVFVGSLALSGTPGPAFAQIPDKFKNLKVLPRNITKDALVSSMRDIAGGLGVHCDYCHVGPPDLTGMDFASDEKTEKRVARAMLAMVGQINGTLIPKAGIDKPTQVKRVTCHRGVQKPETLADLLKAKITATGVDSAKAEYLALKKTYYGSGAYNFTPPTLNEVAEWLANDRNDNDAAIAIMQFSIEQDPGVAYSYNLLGRIQMGKNANEEAIASFKKAIELDPNDKWSARLLARLQAGK